MGVDAASSCSVLPQLGLGQVGAGLRETGADCLSFSSSEEEEDQSAQAISMVARKQQRWRFWRRSARV